MRFAHIRASRFGDTWIVKTLIKGEVGGNALAGNGGDEWSQLPREWSCSMSRPLHHEGIAIDICLFWQ